MADTTHRTYPRGTPFRAPAEQPPAARPRRPFGFALAALGLVLVTAAGTMLVLQLTAASPLTATSENEPPAEAHKPANPRTPPAPKADPLGRSERERYLAGLGMLSAAHVYQTYLNIGLLADGVESGTYTKAEAEQMLTTVTGLINQVDRQLDKLSSTGLDADDRQNIERIQNLTVLLRRQATTLRGYWAAGEGEASDRYHEAREATWKSVSEVLGIE